MPFLLISSIIAIGAILCGGVWTVRAMDQDHRDSQRKTYRLSFPADLSPEQVTTWLRSISGTLRGSPWRLTGAPSVAFEVFATNRGIIHRLKVPYGHEPFIIPQLRLSGINATPEEEFEDRHWNDGVEVGLTQSGRQLRIYDPADVAASILVVLQSFDPDEALLIQWVVSPAAPTKLPIQGVATTNEVNVKALVRSTEATNDEVSDRRRKLEEPNFTAVLRVAGHAKSDSAAKSLVGRVQMALSAIRGPTIRFHKRWVSQPTLRERIRDARSPVVYPMQLSAPELSALIAWPMGRPVIAGLAPTMTRHMPAVAAIPSDGRIIGTSTLPGSERTVAMPYKHAVRHMHVLGPNGTGKTTLMTNMVVQDMQRGHGVILIETKGDLFNEVIARIPDSRVNDVIVVDVNDQEMPVGFNILDQGSSRTSIDEISLLISALYADTSKSIQAPQVLYHMLHALSETPGHTFIDLPVLLANHPNDTPEADWQAWLSDSLKSKDIRQYMQRFMNLSKSDRDRVSGPVYNRTWEFTSRPEIKHLLGQRKSSFQMTDVIKDNKILLVNLNGMRVGQQTAMIAGTLFANAVWQAVRQVKVEKPNFLWLDEFQDIAKFPIGLEAMLAKARGFGLGAVLGHQHTGQLTPETRAAVQANTATKVVFQTTADDARVMAREFGADVKDVDFMNLARYQAIVRVATDTGMSPPATVSTRGPALETKNEQRVRQISRHTYGRPVEDVERELEDRPGGRQEKPRRRPKVSGEDGW